jgi:hypothetical protein
MHLVGDRRHHRGDWRRKQGGTPMALLREITDPGGPKPPAPALVKPHTKNPVHQELLDRAAVGDPSALPAVRELLQDPAWVRALGAGTRSRRPSASPRCSSAGPAAPGCGRRGRRRRPSVTPCRGCPRVGRRGRNRIGEGDQRRPGRRGAWAVGEMALSLGHRLKVLAAGWKLFCERAALDDRVYDEQLPGAGCCRWRRRWPRRSRSPRSRGLVPEISSGELVGAG